MEDFEHCMRINCNMSHTLNDLLCTWRFCPAKINNLYLICYGRMFYVCGLYQSLFGL